MIPIHRIFGKDVTVVLVLLSASAWAANVEPLPVVAGPVVNGIELADSGLGETQPLASLGYLDVTKPPFNADPTGTADATTALQVPCPPPPFPAPPTSHYLLLLFM